MFDTRRVRPSRLAGELVVAIESETSVEAIDLDRQFARTPYAVSFTTGAHEVTLVTLRVLYGETPADRIGELTEIAEWLADWPSREKEWSENLFALGDFNVDRRGDPLWDALTATGLKAPDALNRVPRTIFDGPQEPDFYDQIAWFEENGTRSILTLDFLTAGSFDVVPILQSAMTKTSLLKDFRSLPALGRVLGSIAARARDRAPVPVRVQLATQATRVRRACGSGL